MTETEKAKLIQEAIETKGGKLILEMITDRVMKPMSTDAVKANQQAGVFNLWLELNEYLEK